MTLGKFWGNHISYSRNERRILTNSTRSPLSEFIQKEKEPNKKLDDLLAAEEAFWHQREKAQRLREGDKNT